MASSDRGTDNLGEEDAAIALFVAEAKTKHLNQPSIDILLQDDYNCIEALQTMEEIDLVALGLKGGQRGLVKKWLMEIGAAAFVNMPMSRPVSCQGGSPPRSPLHVTGESCEVEEGPSQPTHASETDADNPEIRTDPEGEEDNSPSSEQGLPSSRESSPEKVQGAMEKVQVKKFVQNLNIADMFKQEITDHVQEQGVMGLDRLLGDKLLEFMACAVNIAVIGRTGTGKSSLINSLRNMRAKDKGAAKVGVVETTTSVFPYLHPKINGVVLWDVPGVNTSNFPRKSYLYDVEFGKYDAFIIVCTDRVLEDDIWLAQEIHRPSSESYTSRPFYFVRTKIDQDIANNIENEIANEEETLKMIRENIESELTKGCIPQDLIFLLSSNLHHQTRFDFPKLTEHLLNQTPPKNQTAMVLAMVSCTKEIIHKKREQLQERLLTVALHAATCGEYYEDIIKKELVLYTERLGVTNVDFDKWGVDVKKLDPHLQKIKRNLQLLLKWLSIKERATKFLIGGVNSVLHFFHLKILMEDFEEKQKEKRKYAEDIAGQRSFEIKRQAAQQALEAALENCEILALGVLEERQFLAKRLPLTS